MANDKERTVRRRSLPDKFPCGCLAVCSYGIIKECVVLEDLTSICKCNRAWKSAWEEVKEEKSKK